MCASPSTYEGFGLPTSRRWPAELRRRDAECGQLRSAAGGAGIVASDEDFAATVVDLLTNPRAEAPDQLGLERAATATWSACSYAGASVDRSRRQHWNELTVPDDLLARLDREFDRRTTPVPRAVQRRCRCRPSRPDDGRASAAVVPAIQGRTLARARALHRGAVPVGRSALRARGPGIPGDHPRAALRLDALMALAYPTGAEAPASDRRLVPGRRSGRHGRQPVVADDAVVGGLASACSRPRSRRRSSGPGKPSAMRTDC